jgi:hypothetical protein
MRFGDGGAREAASVSSGDAGDDSHAASTYGIVYAAARVLQDPNGPLDLAPDRRLADLELGGADRAAVAQGAEFGQ